MVKSTFFYRLGIPLEEPAREQDIIAFRDNMATTKNWLFNYSWFHKNGSYSGTLL